MAQEPKRLAVVNGILCTANEDGSIPLNSKCVELSLDQIASLYNERAELIAALEDARVVVKRWTEPHSASGGTTAGFSLEVLAKIDAALARARG